MPKCFRLLFVFILLAFTTLSAQQLIEEDFSAAESATTARSVPAAIRFTGSVPVVEGADFSQPQVVHFSIYESFAATEPLWRETQTTRVDLQGRFAVVLGSGTPRGIDTLMFQRHLARWISVQLEGQSEGRRIRLLSVPYALEARNAQHLGGRPASDYALTRAAAIAAGSISLTSPEVMAAINNGATNGTANFIAKFDSASTVVNSGIFESAGKVGLNTTLPQQTLQLGGGGLAFEVNQGSYLTNKDYAIMYSSLNSGGAFPFNSNDHMIIQGRTSAAQDIVFATGSPTPIVTAVFRGNGSVTMNRLGINSPAPSQSMQLGAGGLAFEVNQPAYLTNKDYAIMYSSSNGAGAYPFNGNDHMVIQARSSAPQDIVLATGSPTPANTLVLKGSGNVGVGIDSPSVKLDVNGIVRSASGGFRFPDGTTQTTAASGGGGGGGGTITGVTTSASSGLTGGGTTGTLAVSLLTNCAANQILKWSGTAWACAADASGSVGAGAASFTDSNTTSVVSATQGGPGIPNPDPLVNFPPVAVFGRATNATGFTVGVVGRTDASTGIGVVGIATGTGNTEDPAIALSGIATSSTGRTRGVEGSVSSVDGIAGTFDNDAVSGTILQAGFGPDQSHVTMLTVASSGISMGRSGATNSINGPTIIGGNLTVGGTLSKSSGSFKIDHPLDPANKYLYHSFVESPDMMNIYNGVLKLNAKGEAWVTMPEWFQALNQDFRYQLTAIGAPGPNLYVAREIDGNRFKIAGGKPGLKVSWQVTGIRHDAYADANRIPVEEDKGSNKGTYLYPGLAPQTSKSEVAKK